jgi:hypothetical protein
MAGPNLRQFIDSRTHRSKTSTYVCFPCRKHRSLPVYTPLNPHTPTETCPQCSKPMHHIGFRLQVPRKNNDKAWKEFWLQCQAPGYGVVVGTGAEEENAHFERCRAKSRRVLTGEGETGCERCDVVWGRISEREREEWRRRWRREGGCMIS